MPNKHPISTVVYFPGLNTFPTWPQQAFPNIVDTLKSNYDVILSEYKQLMAQQVHSDYDQSSEDQTHKLHKGQWDWRSYVLKGKRQSNFAVHCPQTVSILESFSGPSLMHGTPFSFTFFSTMHKQSSITAHTGPSNLRIRCHFPLLVPSKLRAENGDRAFGMRVADEVTQWQVNEPLFFDDSYEHEVWNHTEEERVILLFDLWHPDLSLDEIAAIQEMFDEARQKGWLKS